MLQPSASTVPAPTFTTLRPRYSYPPHGMYPPLLSNPPHRLSISLSLPWPFPVFHPLLVSCVFLPIFDAYY
jgi:hypothetical protein